jgi:hypothetical protein
VPVIVTLREALAAHAVPETAVTMDLEWYRSEVDDIVRAYFGHYRINAAGAWLPTGMFRNPLFVRMYCEVANPLRLKDLRPRPTHRQWIGRSVP